MSIAASRDKQRVENNIYSNSSRKKKKTYRENRARKIERLCNDFAAELDFFDSNLSVPQWVFEFRDDQIKKIGPKLLEICYFLKSLGLKFKIKWPVEIGGKWKFADVFFPDQQTVLLQSSGLGNFRPMGLDSYRVKFFKDLFRVIEVENAAELQTLMANKRKDTAKAGQ